MNGRQTPIDDLIWLLQPRTIFLVYPNLSSTCFQSANSLWNIQIVSHHNITTLNFYMTCPYYYHVPYARYINVKENTAFQFIQLLNIPIEWASCQIWYVPSEHVLTKKHHRRLLFSIKWYHFQPYCLTRPTTVGSQYGCFDQSQYCCHLCTNTVKSCMFSLFGLKPNFRDYQCLQCLPDTKGHNSKQWFVEVRLFVQVFIPIPH